MNCNSHTGSKLSLIPPALIMEILFRTATFIRNLIPSRPTLLLPLPPLTLFLSPFPHSIKTALLYHYYFLQLQFNNQLNWIQFQVGRSAAFRRSCANPTSPILHSSSSRFQIPPEQLDKKHRPHSTSPVETQQYFTALYHAPLRSPYHISV